VGKERDRSQPTEEDDTMTVRRRAFLVLPALLAAAALSALLALGAPGGGPAIADAHAMEDGHRAAPARQVALRQDMRTLWQEHIVWTRQVIVDFAADLPSLSTSEVRLLRNQTDIGNAIAPFYGKAAGQRLTSLLRGHILIAVDVLAAAKAGDTSGLAKAQARWTRNADQVAGFLSSANPTAWPRAEMRGMMRHHLKLTTDEAVARLTGEWSADVRAYGKIQAQILDMADMLSAGIISQFPQRFR
jgi:hypothetical protein